VILPKLAWRNLWKNQRRTLITMTMIAVGFALALIFLGVADGVHNQMIRNAVRLGSGNLTVEHEDYPDEPSNDKLVEEASALRDRIREVPGIRNVSERIIVTGLIYTSDNSAGVAILGIDAALDMSRKTLEPEIIEGRYLKDNEKRGVLIGADLARRLRVSVGGKAVVTAQDASGQISSQLVRVVGIFRTGIDEMDGYLAQVSLPLARELLGVSDGATQLAVFLENEQNQAQIREQIVPLITGPKATVFDWEDVMPDLVLFVQMDNAGTYIFMGIIMVVVALGILNTILMSVLERTREFGLMVALGMDPRRLLGLVVLETAFLSLVSLGVGAILGFGAHFYLAEYGFDMGFVSQEQLTMAGAVFDSVIYSELAPARVLLLLGIVFAVTFLAGIYPAIRAARVDPVRAITKFQ
jgi:ABC-type lipoprotein release transport system permease subunit